MKDHEMPPADEIFRIMNHAVDALIENAACCPRRLADAKSCCDDAVETLWATRGDFERQLEELRARQSSCRGKKSKAALEQKIQDCEARLSGCDAQIAALEELMTQAQTAVRSTEEAAERYRENAGSEEALGDVSVKVSSIRLDILMALAEVLKSALAKTREAKTALNRKCETCDADAPDRRSYEQAQRLVAEWEAALNAGLAEFPPEARDGNDAVATAKKKSQDKVAKSNDSI